MYLRLYEKRNDMSCIRFKAYDKRVKIFNVLKGEEQVFLVTVSTEGYVSLWGIDFLLDELRKLDHKMMDFGESLEPIYHFEISSRIISLSSRLNFVQVEKNLLKKAKEANASLQAADLKKRINRKVIRRKLIGSKLHKLKSLRHVFSDE